MTTVQSQQATTERAPKRSLTRGQIAVLTIATLPMIAVGAGGAVGTYANASSVLHNSRTALGVVAAGEGATLVAALVMIGVTMLGQAAPAVVRAALWVLPTTASFMGLAIAPTPREAVVYALTPLAMTAAAEGISFLARRIVSHTSGVDVEAQRRNAEILRRIAFHAAQAERHPDEKVQKSSALKAWKLMREVGGGDAQLGSGLIAVQRERLTEGADTALLSMLAGPSEPGELSPVSRALETGEPTGEPTASHSVLPTRSSEPTREPHAPELTDHRPIIQPADQQVSREPVLIPAEPNIVKAAETPVETDAGEPTETEPETDETELQIATLAQRLKVGDRLTKTTAAHLLGVSPATAGRRLKAARDRVNEGTGLYM
ncbi:hypothetical protein [Streptomyces sp. NPDC055105]|uniref:hypothetical protein n=1 Tax=Streptomyces sp. NPDC055105 TaxID=3365719 RepID=UPI0037CDD917